jgi:Leucine-rich repeat (LRR) protein
LPTTTLWGQDAPSDKAKEIAAQFLLKQKNLKNGTVQLGANDKSLALEKMYQSPDTVRNSLYCFQNKDTGFVFVSENGGDCIVVGYSETGQFDQANIPEQLKGILESYEQTERFTIIAPNNLKSGTVVVSPLLDAKGINLNQYNHENVGTCPSGCVATAMAQIMCYYKYPATGTGSNSYTPYSHPEYGVLSADFGNTTYNWTNMTDADYKLLSYHVGVAMNMDYCGHKATNGSTPSAINYENTLQKNFRYNVHYGTPESFYLRNELDNKRPVYCSLPGDPGHAVVIDGYDADGFFHINFGWGGFHNGYFLMNNHSTMDVGYILGTTISTSVFISPTAPPTFPQDSLALVKFHNSMNGRTGWNLNEPVVNWPGVLVMNGRVIRLRLTGMNNVLEGSIPAEIGNLTALQNFNIKGKISGPFPLFLTNLTDLKELAINYYPNSSKVSLPSEIGNLVNLENLNINAGGTIPNTIGNLTQLKNLTLSGGGLTGEIPVEIYSLTNLENLNLGDNQLSGTISPKIGQLINLKNLTLYGNQLSGPLPVEVGSLTELTAFRISHNQFSGVVPDSIGNWSKIKELSIDNNSFEGKLPNTMGKLAQLSTLTINNNKLTSLPDSLGNLSNLQQIVASNNLIDSIPVSISQLSKLFSIDMMNNKLTTLPDMGTMPSLWDLNLSYNQITVLPESFGQLVKISTLQLDNNQLTELPSTFDNLSALKDVSLNQNKLTLLPTSVILLSNLKHLYLMNNQISGTLPPLNHLGLIDLNIYNNKLIFNDIAASKMPDDFDFSDGYYFTYAKQSNVAVSDSLFLFAQEDSVAIDIRKISKLSHPDDVYNWYKGGQPVQTGAVLKFEKFNHEYEGLYSCQITNPNYRNLVLVSNPISIISKGDSIFSDGYHTTSRSNGDPEFTDYQVTLIPPTEVRGNIVWQASVDSLNWHVVTDTLSKMAIKQNIVSITGTKIVVRPKSLVHFRYVVKEEDCDPLISDVLKIKPYGVLLVDTLLNVTNKDLTISRDSIEIVFPPNFSDKEFRLTINKLSHLPGVPDSLKLSSVYDINVSCGNVFKVPLLIKLKNINKKTFNQNNIDRYKAAYYNEKSQQWVTYVNARINLKDSTLVFNTNHLTKIASYDMDDGGYTHRFDKGKVTVFYKFDVGPEDDFYKSYARNIKNKPAELWHDTNTDPFKNGNPYMIQDIAEYTNQVIDKFKSLGLTTSWFNTCVYVTFIKDSEGMADLGGSIKPGGYFHINPAYAVDNRSIQTTVAHEYMHLQQDDYMITFTHNYFWMEANAPLADRMVWDESKIEIAEPEVLFKQALNPSSDGKTIFEVLSKSWGDYTNIPFVSKLPQFIVNTNDANISSSFLHYMRSYRKFSGLKPEVLMVQPPSQPDWLDFLDRYIKEFLLSDVGTEYEGYIKYIVEGSNKNLTLLNKMVGQDPLKYLTVASDNFITKKIFKFKSEKVIKDNVRLNIPYMATKMVQIYNGNLNQDIIVRYKRKSEKQPNLKAYMCKYDIGTDKMIFEDISDSSTFVIQKAGPNKMERKHIAFLLFINKDKSEDFNIDYELEVFNIPDFKMVDGFTFYRNWGVNDGSKLEDLKIHFITDGMTEEPRILPFMAQVFRTDVKSYDPGMSYKTETTDSTIIVQASSKDFDQTTTYNYVTGRMVIHEWDNWGSPWPTPGGLDTREFTLVLENVWLTPDVPNSLGITYLFNTKNTAETQNVVKSISYTRRFKYLSGNPPVYGPIVTYTYLRTTYPTDDIKLHMQFW